MSSFLQTRKFFSKKTNGLQTEFLLEESSFFMLEGGFESFFEN
ncbi:MAG: hypothetical protein OXN83_04240 [Oligoflexia bacterium]|nr:hypothetical protein [Oligoflexia bacterium]